MNTTQSNGIRTTEISPGDLIFLDSFSGFVPAKVTGYATWGDIKVQITAERGAYRRGEHTTFTPSRCVPRNHIRLRRGHYYIFGSWTFEGLANEYQPRWA